MVLIKKISLDKRGLDHHYSRENMTHVYNLKISSRNIKKSQNLVCMSHTAHLNSHQPHVKCSVARSGE